MTSAATDRAATLPLAARVARWLSAAPDTAAALVIANLVPLVGVIAFDWSVVAILLVYWVESGVIGLLNIPKMLLARGPLTVESGGVSLSLPVLTGGAGRALYLAFHLPFFIVHYGIFWLGHGFFVLMMPIMAAIADTPGVEMLDPFALIGVEPTVILVAAGGLLASHLVSFWRNFLGRHEYRTVSVTQQMMAPYGRVVVMHVTVLVGGFLSLAVGSPIGAMVVLVGLKTAIDLHAHLREHRRARAAREAVAVAPSG